MSICDQFLGVRAKYSRGITVSRPWVPWQLSVDPCGCIGGEHSEGPSEPQKVRKFDAKFLWGSVIWEELPSISFKSTQWDKSRTNSYSAQLAEFWTSGFKMKLIMYPCIQSLQL